MLFAVSSGTRGLGKILFNDSLRKTDQLCEWNVAFKKVNIKVEAFFSIQISFSISKKKNMDTCINIEIKI